MRYLSPLAVLCALPVLAACDGGTDPYPSLLPTEQILAEPTLPDDAGVAATGPEGVDAELAARASGLQGRAGGLRRPVIEPELRAQMQRADE